MCLAHTTQSELASFGLGCDHLLMLLARPAPPWPLLYDMIFMPVRNVDGNMVEGDNENAVKTCEEESLAYIVPGTYSHRAYTHEIVSLAGCLLKCFSGQQ